MTLRRKLKNPFDLTLVEWMIILSIVAILGSLFLSVTVGSSMRRECHERHGHWVRVGSDITVVGDGTWVVGRNACVDDAGKRVWLSGE